MPIEFKHSYLDYYVMWQTSLVLQVLQDFSDGLQTQMLLTNLMKTKHIPV